MPQTTTTIETATGPIEITLEEGDSIVFKRMFYDDTDGLLKSDAVQGVRQQVYTPMERKDCPLMFIYRTFERKHAEQSAAWSMPRSQWGPLPSAVPANQIWVCVAHTPILPVKLDCLMWNDDAITMENHATWVTWQRNPDLDAPMPASIIRYMHCLCSGALDIVGLVDSLTPIARFA